VRNDAELMVSGRKRKRRTLQRLVATPKICGSLVSDVLAGDEEGGSYNEHPFPWCEGMSYLSDSIG